MAKKPKASTLADDIRAAIKFDGKSANEIAKATDVPQPTITRFIAGADPRLSTASKLAAHLGLALERKIKLSPRNAPRAPKLPETLNVEIVHGEMFKVPGIKAISKKKRKNGKRGDR